jgi:hypothetical protein
MKDRFGDLRSLVHGGEVDKILVRYPSLTQEERVYARQALEDHFPVEWEAFWESGDVEDLLEHAQWWAKPRDGGNIARRPYWDDYLVGAMYMENCDPLREGSLSVVRTKLWSHPEEEDLKTALEWTLPYRQECVSFWERTVSLTHEQYDTLAFHLRSLRGFLQDPGSSSAWSPSFARPLVDRW